MKSMLIFCFVKYFPLDVLTASFEVTIVVNILTLLCVGTTNGIKWRSLHCVLLIFQPFLNINILIILRVVIFLTGFPFCYEPLTIAINLSHYFSWHPCNNFSAPDRVATIQLLPPPISHLLSPSSAIHYSRSFLHP